MNYETIKALENLVKLKKNGLISSDEFENRKQKIINNDVQTNSNDYQKKENKKQKKYILAYLCLLVFSIIGISILLFFVKDKFFIYFLIGIFISYMLLYLIFLFLGRIWSSLLSGVCFFAIFLYISYTSVHNTQFLCDKKNNQCTVLENSLINKQFKEIRHFNISDIKDVQYDETTRTRWRRKRGMKKYTDRSIIFYCESGKREYFPSIFVTDNSQKNNHIVRDIRAYLNNDNENFYSYKTEKENSPNWLYGLLAFLFGSILGLGTYSKFFDKDEF